MNRAASGDRRFVHRYELGVLLAGVLPLTSCSLVLGWNGYTGGDAGDGAAVAEGAADAVTEGAADSVAEGAAAPPACGPQNCGGCCQSAGCATGIASETCGQGGLACENCVSQGLACSGGICVSPPGDSGPAPCSLIACKTLLTCLTSIDIACCKPDGSCGCQSVLGPSGCM